MNKRLFRSTSFAIVAASGVSLAALAGAQEPQSSVLTRAGWSITAQEIRADEDDRLRLTGDVQLRRDAWRISARSADVTSDTISLEGAVRIAGPRVYVMSTSADVRAEAIEASPASVVSDELQLDAQRVSIRVTESSVRLFEVGDGPHPANAAPFAPRKKD